MPKLKGKTGKGHFWKLDPNARNQFNESTVRRRPRGYKSIISNGLNTSLNRTSLSNLNLDSNTPPTYVYPNTHQQQTLMMKPQLMSSSEVENGSSNISNERRLQNAQSNSTLMNSNSNYPQYFYTNNCNQHLNQQVTKSGPNSTQLGNNRNLLYFPTLIPRSNQPTVQPFGCNEPLNGQSIDSSTNFNQINPNDLITCNPVSTPRLWSEELNQFVECKISDRFSHLPNECINHLSGGDCINHLSNERLNYQNHQLNSLNRVESFAMESSGHLNSGLKNGSKKMESKNDYNSPALEQSSQVSSTIDGQTYFGEQTNCLNKLDFEISGLGFMQQNQLNTYPTSASNAIASFPPHTHSTFSPNKPIYLNHSTPVMLSSQLSTDLSHHTKSKLNYLNSSSYSDKLRSEFITIELPPMKEQVHYDSSQINSNECKFFLTARA